MDSNELRLLIESYGSTRAEQSDLAAQSLLEELRGIPRLVADRSVAPAQPGFKSAGAVMAEIVVGLGAAHALLPTVVNAIRDWLLRQPPATRIKLKVGKVELDWTGATPPKEILNAVTTLTAEYHQP